MGLQHIRVYSNQIEFTPQGFELNYPWFDPQAPRNGTSKGSIIRSYQARQVEVVYIGDGFKRY